MLDLFNLLKSAQEHEEWKPRGHHKTTRLAKLVKKNRKRFVSKAVVIKPRHEYEKFALNLELGKIKI